MLTLNFENRTDAAAIEKKALFPSGILRRMLNYSDAVFGGYSEIFFLRNRYVGMLLFLTTLIYPNLAISGLVAVLAAHVFANLVEMDHHFIESGFYTYNPLLVGLGIGYLFKINYLSLLFIGSAGILTFIITVALSSFFMSHFRLPVLSLPFTIISSLVYLASSKYSNLFVTGLHTGTPSIVTFFENLFPYWASGYFRSLGTIFFMPAVLPGLIIAVILFASSRILFLMTLTGYYSGTLFEALLTGSYTQAFSNINHFNFILIAIAIGGIFLIPSVKSYIIGIIAVVVSGILVKSMEVFWLTYGIPGFTLPFNIVTLSLVYVLGLIHFPLVASMIRSTPEETLDQYLSNRSRFKGGFRTISLPFWGKWTLWQGFDGKWTHRGNLKYACDFIIRDENGESYGGDGGSLRDYYAWQRPVLSPVRGRIVKVVNHIRDNDIGTVDNSFVWGNLVVIKDDRGFFAALAHFAKGSIKVNEGDWVERGTFLGLCGNSGYSPQPHIHIQVQTTEEMGSPTLPFSFNSYSVKDVFYDNNVPDEEAVVESLYKDKSLDLKTSFMLDDRMDFDVYRDGRAGERISLKVKLGADGTFYLDSGKGKLFFRKQEGAFYFYSVEGDDENLKQIFTSIPKIPLTGLKNLRWYDRVPLGLISSGLYKNLFQLLASFFADLARTTCEYEFVDKDVIEGEVSSWALKIEKRTRVVLDENVGFKSIKTDNRELRRVKDVQIRG